MEGFSRTGILVWFWEQGVYGPGEAGLLILGRPAAKASFSLLNFGPHPVPFLSQPGSGRGKPAFRTTGHLVRVWRGESLGWGGMQEKGVNLLVAQRAPLNPWG